MAATKPKQDDETGPADGVGAAPGESGADATAATDGSAADGAADGDGAGTPDRETGTAPPPDLPTAPAAAPVDPPKQRRQPDAQRSPAVEPSAAMRDVPGRGHVALVDHSGERLVDEDELFSDEGGHFTYVITRRRIYQAFKYPGTSTVTTQLLFPANAHVPRDKAEQVKQMLRKQNADGK